MSKNYSLLTGATKQNRLSPAGELDQFEDWQEDDIAGAACQAEDGPVAGIGLWCGREWPAAMGAVVVHAVRGLLLKAKRKAGASPAVVIGSIPTFLSPAAK